MFRGLIARRSLAVCLGLIVLLALAAPALAAGRTAPEEPAGLIDQVIAWMADLWTSAGNLLDPLSGAGSLDGGCGFDPSGNCHGSVTPPAGEGE